MHVETDSEMATESEAGSVGVKLEVEVDLGIEDAPIQEERCVNKDLRRRIFECDQCPYAAAQKGHLKQHIARAHERYPINVVDPLVEAAPIQEQKCGTNISKQPCSSCVGTTVAEDKCKRDQCPYEEWRYQKSVHYTQYTEKKFKCDQCPYVAFNPLHVRQHIAKAHKVSKLEHKQAIDGSKFITKDRQERKLSKTMTFLRKEKLPKPWGLLYKRKLIWDEQKVGMHLRCKSTTLPLNC